MSELKKVFLEEVDSTNNYAKKISISERGDVLIAAKRQTAGKGRMGRTFFSPESGIYMSLLLHPDFPVERTDQITGMAAVAVSRAVAKVFGIETHIKWVNDIYIGNKKVGGILCEGAINPDCGKFEYVVLGVGVNLARPEGDFPDEIKDIAAALKEKVSDRERQMFLDCFIKMFYEIYSGESEYISEYKDRSNVLGKEIEYISGGKLQRGTAEDITDDARLVIKDKSGIKTLNSGEIKILVNSII